MAVLQGFFLGGIAVFDSTASYCQIAGPNSNVLEPEVVPMHASVRGTTTVPRWIGAIGGSLSLFLAFVILLSDRARATASQAAKAACWRRWPTTQRVGQPITEAAACHIGDSATPEETS